MSETIEKKSVMTTVRKLCKRWFIDAFTGMAHGLFVTLIAGTIIKQVGELIGKGNKFGQMLIVIGSIAQMMTGAGIGAGIASHLKAPKLVIFSCIVAGMLGAFSLEFIQGSLIQNVLERKFVVSPGNPVGAYISALLACEIGMLVSGKTKLDILIVPVTTIALAFVGLYIGYPFVKFINIIGTWIQTATTVQPFIMGIILSASVGLLLTMPTSSAAICISMQIGGLAGGAAVVGCAAHMIGFAVASFRDNKFSGLISQGIGTSMLQIPNIMKKPIILLPAVISSIVVGPLASTVFKLSSTPAGSGMGTAGLVGIFTTIDASLASGLSGLKIGFGIALLFFIIPAVVSLLVSEIMRRYGWIKPGDMKLEFDN